MLRHLRGKSEPVVSRIECVEGRESARFLLFKSEEAGCSVSGQNGVVGVGGHASGIALDSVVIQSILEKLVTLRKKKKRKKIINPDFINQFVYSSVFTTPLLQPTVHSGKHLDFLGLKQV